MKHFVACTSFALCLALPITSFARDHRDDRDGRGGYSYRDDHGYRDNRGGYDRGHDRGGYYDRGHWHAGGPVRFVGQVIALPFVVGAALIGATVEAVSAPFNGRYYAEPQRASYGPAPDDRYYDDRDDRGYEAPVGRVYGPPPPGYYEQPQPDYRGY
jgi:hypothetical protein